MTFEPGARSAWHTAMTHLAVTGSVDGNHETMTTEQTLSAKQRAIPPSAAFMTTSDMPKLNTALNQGLDAGLTISETKEILVQLYAYVGFPRSLDALGELMKRRGRANSAASHRHRTAPTSAPYTPSGCLTGRLPTHSLARWTTEM